MTRRIVVQLLALACFIALVIVPPGPTSSGQLVHPFFYLDPYLALVVLLSTGSISLGALAGALLMAALTARRGAFFCRNLCPMGTSQDLVPRLRRTVAPSLEECHDEPNLLRAPKSTFRLQPWLFVMLLVMAALRFLPAQLLDPLALVAQGVIALQELALRGSVSPPILIGGGLFLGILIASATRQRRFFCNHYCPLGQTLQLIQIASMPARAAAAAPVPIPAGATPSARVPMPAGALLSTVMNRRGVLGAAVMLPVAGLASRLGASPVLRPPGALPELEFLFTCVRCGQCTASCPTGTIEPCILEAGVTGFMSPRLTLSRAACLPGCIACQESCPTGALSVLAPPVRRAWRIGLARVEPSRCLRSGGKDCRVCREACPYDAIGYPHGKGLMVPYVEPDLCIGCGLCEVACPPGQAIVVRKEQVA